MRNELGFYKYLRNNILNTRIKYFQTINKYILEPKILHHNIIVLLQMQEPKCHNGTSYGTVVLYVLE